LFTGVHLVITLAQLQAQDTGKQPQGQRVDPLSREQTLLRIPFFFQSLSGDVLSATNIQTQTQLLTRTQEIIVGDVCWRENGAECAAPRSLIQVCRV